MIGNNKKDLVAEALKCMSKYMDSHISEMIESGIGLLLISCAREMRLGCL